jgi:hypothetical protein
MLSRVLVVLLLNSFDCLFKPFIRRMSAKHHAEYETTFTSTR